MIHSTKISINALPIAYGIRCSIEFGITHIVEVRITIFIFQFDAIVETIVERWITVLCLKATISNKMSVGRNSASGSPPHHLFRRYGPPVVRDRNQSRRHSVIVSRNFWFRTPPNWEYTWSLSGTNAKYKIDNRIIENDHCNCTPYLMMHRLSADDERS